MMTKPQVLMFAVILAFLSVQFLYLNVNEADAQCYQDVGGGDAIIVPCPDNAQEWVYTGTNSRAFQQADGSYEVWGDCYLDEIENTQCRRLADLNLCDLPDMVGVSEYIPNLTPQTSLRVLVTLLERSDSQNIYQINVQDEQGFNISPAFNVTFGDAGVCPVIEPTATPPPPIPDQDGDGVPDVNDVCEGDDASGDSNGDGICNNVDNPDGDNFFGADDWCPDNAGRAGGCETLELYFAALEAAGIDIGTPTDAGDNNNGATVDNSSCAGVLNSVIIVPLYDVNPCQNPGVIYLRRDNSPSQIATSEIMLMDDAYCAAIHYQNPVCEAWATGRAYLNDEERSDLSSYYNNLNDFCRDLGGRECTISWDVYCSVVDDAERCGEFSTFDELCLADPSRSECSAFNNCVSSGLPSDICPFLYNGNHTIPLWEVPLYIRERYCEFSRIRNLNVFDTPGCDVYMANLNT
jgi:hypothetical protein